MISLSSAQRLRDAGLDWQPSHGDRFAIPGRDLDRHQFVLNDLSVWLENLYGKPTLTFHGTPEWALDYVYVGDTVWLPDEGQLREALQRTLAETGSDVFDLLYADSVYTCRFEWGGESLAFQAADAAEAYAAALAHVLGAGEKRSDDG